MAGIVSFCGIVSLPDEAPSSSGTISDDSSSPSVSSPAVSSSAVSSSAVSSPVPELELSVGID